jgi:hypothetical protein
MRAKNVGECVNIVGSRPTVAPRYGDAIHDLNAAWLRAIRTRDISCGSFCLNVANSSELLI